MNRKDNTSFSFVELEDHESWKKYEVSIKIPMSVGWIENCTLVLEDGGNTREIPLTFDRKENDSVIFKSTVDLGTRAVYRTFFSYTVGYDKFYVTRKDTKKHIPYDEKIKLSVNFEVPDWAKGAVMYHVFVDRFYRGNENPPEDMKRRIVHSSWDEDVVLGNNPDVMKHYDGEEVWNVDFYGGDLKGITKKLDYIESLGVTILYLSPIVFSQSNHRYDSADYEKVDPYVGVNDDLKELCREAHKRGMRVVVDAVFNHTGDESKYFDRHHDFQTGNPKENGCFENPESKYAPFYRYKENGGFSYWWDFPTLPEVNCDGEFWQNYICGEGGIIDQWFSLGIDGLRLDVADNLSDHALELIHDAVVRNKKDGFILGEVWDNPMRNGRSYISSGRSMHSVMNYPLVDGAVRYFKYREPNKLEYTIRDIQAEYPEGTVPALMNFTSTHDISRGITLIGKKNFDGKNEFRNLEPELRNKVFEALWEIGFSNDDIFALFYGSIELDYYDYRRMMEILRYKGVSEKTIQKLQSILSFTPFERHSTWAKDLPEDIKKDLDYTKKYQFTPEEYKKARDVYQAYLFFLATYPGIMSIFYGDEVGMQGLNNLANRRPYPWGKEDMRLLQYVRELGQFRKKYSFLKEAGIELIEIKPSQLSFERVNGDEKLFVSINNTESPRAVVLPKEYKDGEKVLSLKKSRKEYLAPYGGIAIKK